MRTAGASARIVVWAGTPTSATAATTSPPATTGAATPDVPIRHSSWENATPVRRMPASCSRSRFGRTIVRRVNARSAPVPTRSSSASGSTPASSALPIAVACSGMVAPPMRATVGM